MSLRFVFYRTECGLELVSAAGASSTTASATAASSTTATSTTSAPAAAGASATAVSLEVGIADDEAASHQALHVVNGGAVEQRSAVGVHKHLDCGGVNDEVVFTDFLLDAQHILDSALRTGHDHDSEHTVLVALLFQDVLEFFGGQIADL